MSTETAQSASTNEIVLSGCSPSPLASYLKALAVLRLLAEAGDHGGGDADVTGYWNNDQFVLRTKLKVEEICDFFLLRYQPTPLVAPWNGGSGFYPKDNTDGIRAIAGSSNERFAAYRQSIAAAKAVVSELSLKESPKFEEKTTFLQTLRNLAPDGLLRWMDAAVILSGEDPRYPPLLGTGGNDGRLDFTNNFMQRQLELFDVSSGQPRGLASEGLKSALFDMPTTSLSDRAIGQFAPGAAGGPNASADFDGAARINAWDFVLMLEGAVLFAASTSRKLETSDSTILSAPFTVRSRAGTAGSASSEDDGDARGEIWMPLWFNPFSIEELRCLLAEGRAALNGKATRDGLDFARAVAQLGVDRGIDEFQRYGFLMRSGKAFLATPLNRVKVSRNIDADLIQDLEKQRNWLGSVQRYARDENAPNAFRSAARQLDSALFALTQQSTRGNFQKVLTQIGKIDAALSLSPRSQDAIRSPAPTLKREWAEKAGGEAATDSAEFRIAMAFAGLRMSLGGGRGIADTRMHLTRVGEPGFRSERQWDPNSSACTWGPGPLTGNIAALLHRRRLISIKHGVEGELLASITGATCDDVADFLAGATDDGRITDLLGGLACVKLQGIELPRSGNKPTLPAGFALLKLFFTTESQLRKLNLPWFTAESRMRLPAEMAARLVSNQIDAAIELAWRRLLSFSVKLPGLKPPRMLCTDGPRLLAALCIPLSQIEIRRLIETLDLEAKLSAEQSD